MFAIEERFEARFTRSSIHFGRSEFRVLVGDLRNVVDQREEGVVSIDCRTRFHLTCLAVLARRRVFFDIGRRVIALAIRRQHETTRDNTRDFCPYNVIVID